MNLAVNGKVKDVSSNIFRNGTLALISNGHPDRTREVLSRFSLCHLLCLLNLLVSHVFHVRPLRLLRLGLLVEVLTTRSSLVSFFVKFRASRLAGRAVVRTILQIILSGRRLYSKLRNGRRVDQVE